MGSVRRAVLSASTTAENDEYELEGSETVSVEEGFLYFDSADGDGAPQDGSTKPKVEKRSK